jgi:hypothetical protein
MLEMTEFVKSVGFPIAITIYLIMRLDGLLGTIRDQLTMQTEILRDIKKNGGTK